MHLLLGQKKPEDEYKDPDMLLKFNKSDMAGIMEAIEEYLRSHQGVARASLSYFIRNTTLVQSDS